MQPDRPKRFGVGHRIKSRSFSKRPPLNFQNITSDPPGSDLERWIVPESVVIICVPVACSDAEDATGKNFSLRIDGVERISRIGFGMIDSADEIEPLLDFA